MSTSTIEKPEIISKPKRRLCPRYKIIMHNDNITTMPFVVAVLRAVFNKSEQDAKQIMLEIHFKEQALVGVYALEHAELKRDQTHSSARARGYPLTCTIEPND